MAWSIRYAPDLAPTDPLWTTVPTISFIQGSAAVADVTAYVTNGSVVWKNSVTLPNGVTYNEALKRFEYNGVGAADGSNGHVLYADNESALTTLGLTSTFSATHPFAVAQPLKKGDLPAGRVLVSRDTESLHCSILRTWDDGSAKLVLLAGTAALTANTLKTLTLRRGTGNPSGTNLAESNLITANPTATVVAGTSGTVSLASLLGTSALVATEKVSPQYAEFEYVAAFPSTSTLWAIFHVQLWKDGPARVRIRVVNGSNNYSGSDITQNYTVNIGSSQVLNTSVALGFAESFDCVGWNMVDPAVTPSHNDDYLRSTTLVANYAAAAAPSSAVLDALPTSYTPKATVGLRTNMTDPGFHPTIGLELHSGACYCVTGDKRAYDSVIAQARAFQMYPIHLRSSTTKFQVKPSEFPTATNNNDIIANSGFTLIWDGAHNPNCGYLAYLLTGERFYQEIMEANMWGWHYANNSGSGTSRPWRHQTRAVAWAMRTYSSFAAVCSSTDGWVTDARSTIAYNVGLWYTNFAVPNVPATGLGLSQGDLEFGTAGNQLSLFEHLFLAAACGFAWDIDPGLSAADKAKQAVARDYFYQVPTGCLGRGQAQNEWNYRQGAGPYRTNVGPGPNISDQFYTTWGDMQQATYNDGMSGADGQSLTEEYIDHFDGSFAEGNWGHVLTAISYAKDHGYIGASICYTRLTTATNWAANITEFNNRPQYGVVSRT